MMTFYSRGVAIVLTATSIAFGKVIAQDSVTREQSVPGTTSAPELAVASGVVPSVAPASHAAHSERPTLMVLGFESGTVSAQVKDRRAFQSILFAMHGDRNNESYDPSQLGIGIADMLIEKLLATGQFRLIERKPVDSRSGAQFVVTGSVTRFGFEERNVGGIFASVATMGLLSYKQHKTEVALTARIINAATGEIVASVTSDGASGKGGGLRVFGMGSNGMGGADVSSSNFRSTAIGQATERAVSELAAKILEKRASF